jgi:hypothetical protein
MEVHAAALPLNLVDLAFAVVLATGLEGEQLRVLGKPLQGRQQVTYRRTLRVATRAHYVRSAKLRLAVLPDSSAHDHVGMQWDLANIEGLLPLFFEHLFA